MATERIEIRVTETGTRIVKRRLDEVGRSGARAAGGVSALQAAVAALGGSLAIRQTLRLADAYTNLQNRLRLVTGSSDELRAVQAELLAVSNRTRTSLDENAELFNRLSLSLAEYAVTQEQVLRLTESINQATLISGASTQEASAGIIQLSQGLASGALRGDELRSVLEQLPAVADVIARSLNVGRGDLRALGAEGKLTAEVILQAFEEAADDLDARFQRVAPTFEQALIVLRNNFIQSIGELEERFGVIEKLSDLIIKVGDNTETAKKVVLGTLAAITTAVLILTAAASANPLGLLLIGLSAGVGLVVAFADEIKEWLNTIRTAEDDLTSLGDIISAVLSEGPDMVRRFVSISVEGFRVVLDAGRALFGGVRDALMDLGVDLDEIRQRFDFRTLLINAGAIFDGLFKSLVGIVSAIRSVLGDLEDLILATFRNPLQAALTFIEASVNLIIQIINGLMRQIQFGIRSALQIAADAASFISEDLANTVQGLIDSIVLPNLDPVDFVDGGETEAALQNLGANAAQAYADGFEGAGTPVSDAIQSVLETANENALERVRQGELFSKPDKPVDLSGLEAGGGQGSTGRGRGAQQLEDLLADLEREGDLLRLNNRQREIRTELIRQETAFRRAAGRDLTEEERAEIESLLARNQLLADQAQILDSIRGPQEEYERGFAAINELLAEGRITLEEYNGQLALLEENFVANPVQEILADLQEEAMLLQLSNREREIAVALRQAEQDLIQQGVAATEDQLRQIELQLQANQALQERAAILNEIRGPQEEYNAQVARLNELLSEGAINSDEFSRKSDEFRLAFLEDQNDFASGFERAILRLKISSEDFAATAEEAFNTTFNTASQALTNFVETGKLDFRGLAASIISDLARIAIQKAIAAAVGGIGGGAGAVIAGLFADGGVFNNGRQVQMFANGGVVNGATAFPTNSGIGVMGEAGPEAILPLTRTRGGKLGVQTEGSSRPIQNVTINVSTPNPDGFRRSGPQIAGSIRSRLT